MSPEHKRVVPNYNRDNDVAAWPCVWQPTPRMADVQVGHWNFVPMLTVVDIHHQFGGWHCPSN